MGQDLIHPYMYFVILLASTLDSASTQRQFNKLIDEFRVADENLFGPAPSKTVELIENFCSMHLGINLPKAFLSGISENGHDSHDRQYNQVDTLVHEFCKLVWYTRIWLCGTCI